MRYPRPMARILNSVRLFSFSVFSFWSSQSESTAYLSPFSNSPPVPVIDNDLPYERYSEAVRRLRPLFSPTCPLFEPGEVTVIGDTPIAAGGFADIWKGTRGYGRDSHNVIQKTYRCYEICDVERTFRRFLSEVWVLTQLSHPNTARFLGINPTPDHPFALVLDTGCDLGLREYLDEYPKVDRLKLVLGIAWGLKHVHDLDIVHGHLAPENILVGPDGTPRITGFGSSLIIARPDLWSGKDVVDFFYGNAPELNGSRTKATVKITKASDIYAFGVLTWQIFGDLDVRRASKGGHPSRLPRHVGLSDRAWKLVKACCRDLPSRRMTADRVVALIEAE